MNVASNDIDFVRTPCEDCKEVSRQKLQFVKIYVLQSNVSIIK
jgi:hypothetical protein